MAYIRDVHDPLNIIAQISEILFQYILHDIAAEVADMGKVVYRRAAGVHFNLSRFVGNQLLLGSGQ